MNLRTVLLAVIVLGACSTHKDKLQRAKDEANSAGRILMVEFGADWCSDCRVLSAELEKDSYRQRLATGFVRYRVDVGEFDRNLDVAKSVGLNLSQIPTAVFFTPAGGRIERSGTSEILDFVKTLKIP